MLNVFVMAFFFIVFFGCGPLSDSSELDDTGLEAMASPKTTARNGFIYPISGIRVQNVVIKIDF
jgi:hypothetical protein